MNKPHLSPDQIRDIERLNKYIPKIEDQQRMLISMAKHSSHLIDFIHKNKDFLDLPLELSYRISLIFNFIWPIFGPEQLSEIEFESLEYLPQFDVSTLEGRFEKVLAMLNHEAKKRGIKIPL